MSVTNYPLMQDHLPGEGRF